MKLTKKKKKIQVILMQKCELEKVKLKEELMAFMKQILKVQEGGVLWKT